MGIIQGIQDVNRRTRENERRKKREETMRSRYGEFPDDPEKMDQAFVSDLYRYGDIEGIKEWTELKAKQAKASGKEQNVDPDKRFHFLGAQAEESHAAYESALKQTGDPEQAQTAADKIFIPAQREALRMGYIGRNEMEPRYNHENASAAIKVFRNWSAGKEKSGGSEPSDVKRFRIMYPGVRLNSEEGRRQFIELEKKLKNDPYLGKAIDMTIGDPRSMRMSPDQLSAKIDENYNAIMNSDAGGGRMGGGKKLDAETARALLKEAKGDKRKARELAKQRGFIF